eukprot:TRINITY_DN1546_c0_g1_i1.p1 TRINITY_DN1546_c0_g1~~TRINITY_DN1546_c0_g1_i1.p1  ORF type:complete len:1496 (+),score=260.21 TRINITY_DN1546_c0_g1_i1:5178-9665(+)
MPTEEAVRSPRGDDQSVEQQPPASPKHVFDDDIEVQSQSAIDGGNTQPAADDHHNPTPKHDANPTQSKVDPPPTNTQPESAHPSQSSAQISSQRNEDDGDGDEPDRAETASHTSSTLFEKILDKPARAPSLVSAWMSHVSVNGPDAMASLVSLVMSAARPVPCAHDQLVTSQMIIANNPPESVKEMCQTMAVDAPERVVVLAKDTASRRVRRAYEDFWRRIAAEAPDIVLYHTDCFDTLIPWLDAMSSAPIRALRVSACIAAYRLVDGFIEVNCQLRKHLASIQRQLNTERRRSGINVHDQNAKTVKNRRTSAKGKKKELSVKGKELANKVDELTAKDSELTELSDRVYRTMFICRYRDISADVRSLSISALGGWIIMFPEQFLDDTHNKYIGWLLSDKDAGVRKTSLDVLHRMLKKKDYFANFETFLQRFSDRIFEMAWDKDDLVAVTAIRLLNFLLPYNQNSKLLRPSHCESVCAIALGDSHTEIRHAAGEFLATLVTMDIDDVGASVAKPKRAYRKRSGRRSSSGPFNTLLREIPPVERAKDDIRELLYAMARKEDDAVDEALTVDSVWDHLPALRCWQAFEELLRESPDSNSNNEDEEVLSETEKGMLCRILLASAAEASGNGDPNRAKIVEKGEYADPETPSVLLSKQFLPLLPRLLSQYQSDSTAVCALIQLPQHFEMSTFDQQGHESYFSTLLDRIIAVLLKHTGSEDVTAACAETLRCFLSDQNPLKKATSTALQLCCQSATKDLSLQIRADLSKSEPDNIAALVSQVRVLAELVDTGLSTYETVKEVLLYQENNLQSSELGALVTVDTIRVACAFAVWSLSRIKSRIASADSSETPLEDVLDLEEVKEYRKHGTDVTGVLQRICGNSSMPIPVRLISARCILIVLTLCRGIEKNAEMKIIRGRADSDTTQGATDLDILNLKDSVPNLVEVMRSVVHSLVDSELHQRRSRSSKRASNPSTPNEDDRRDFFACLVQASLQSFLSRSISHLPLLGVLLTGAKEERGLEASDYTTSRVCRDYLQQRQIRKTSLTQDIIRALGEVTALKCSKEEHQNIIRELAESCVSFRYRRDLKAKASTELLQGLIDYCSSSTTETDFVHRLLLLSCASFAVVSHISQEDGQKAMEQISAIDTHLTKYNDSVGEDLVKLFEVCRSSIAEVVDGKTPDLPSFSKIVDRPASSGGIPSRRRKRRTRSPRARTPLPEPVTVRKSSRLRKKVDYARMEIHESEEEEEEGEEEEEEEGDNEEVSSERGNDNTSQSEPTVADVARNMMEYENSPLAVRKRTSREVPSADLSPAKRRRRNGDGPIERETADPVQRKEGKHQSSIHNESGANEQQCSDETAEREHASQLDGEESSGQNSSERVHQEQVEEPELKAEPGQRRSKRVSANRKPKALTQSNGKQNGRRSRRNIERGKVDVSSEENVDSKGGGSKVVDESNSSSEKSLAQSDARTEVGGKGRTGSSGKNEVKKQTPLSKKAVVQRRKVRRW